MQLDIKFPIFVRAQPAATRKVDRRFFGSYVYQAEITEISMDETEIGLEELGFLNGKRERRVFPQLRAYNGRLYRPLGNPEGLFEDAFSRDRFSYGIDYIVTDPPTPGAARRPLAFPIRDWTQWYIDVHGMDTSRNYKLWPEDARAPLPPVSRNDIDFSTTDFRNVNSDDLALYMKMFKAQANRLLIIGGKFWMETTKPCLTVTMSGGGEQAKKVTLDAGFLPLVSPRTSTWMRFPLSSYGEAVTYAEEMKRSWGGSNDIGFAETDGMDLSSVIFDPDEEAVHAMALAVGSNLVRRTVQHEFHQVHQDSMPLFEGRRLDRFLTIKDAILSNNDIIGERSDLVGLLPEIMDYWNSLKSPRYVGLGMPPAGISGVMIQQALEMAENTTINLLPSATPRF
jgi:hypothetical protein